MKHLSIATVSALALLIASPVLAAEWNTATTEQGGNGNVLDLTQ